MTTQPSKRARGERVRNTAGLPGFVTEEVALADLHPHPENYQQHPEDELLHLQQSLREHGFFRPIVVANDDTILAGHGIVLAALALGLTHGPVHRRPYGPSDPLALKLLVADNEIRHLAEVDDRALTNLLRELQEQADLLGTGYDELMLANLAYVTRPASEIADLDEAAQWVGLPAYDERGEERLQVILNFACEEDRVRACDLLGLDAASIPTEGARKSVWWPPRARRFDDNTALRFTDGGGAGGGGGADDADADDE